MSGRGISKKQVLHAAQQVKDLYEQRAILWQQACRIEGISSKQPQIVFSDSNQAAQNYIKVVAEYLKMQGVFKLLTGRYWKPIKEKEEEKEKDEG